MHAVTTAGGCFGARACVRACVRELRARAAHGRFKRMASELRVSYFNLVPDFNKLGVLWTGDLAR